MKIINDIKKGQRNKMVAVLGFEGCFRYAKNVLINNMSGYPFKQ